MCKFVALIFPEPIAVSEEEKAKRKAKLGADIQSIRGTNWGKNVEVALEEARNLVAAEGERKQAAQNKASIYLAVVAGLIPFIFSQANDFGDKSLGGYNYFMQYFLIALFFVGTIYLLLSSIWSFRVLNVSTHNRVDVEEYSKIWKQEKPRELLVSELFVASLRNREGVNEKISYLKLTHIYLIRSIFVFASIFMLIALSKIDYKAAFEFITLCYGTCN